MISSQHIKLTMDSMRKGPLIQVPRFLSPNFSLLNQRSPRSWRRAQTRKKLRRELRKERKGKQIQVRSYSLPFFISSIAIILTNTYCVLCFTGWFEVEKDKTPMFMCQVNNFPIFRLQ